MGAKHKSGMSAGMRRVIDALSASVDKDGAPIPKSALDLAVDAHLSDGGVRYALRCLRQIGAVDIVEFRRPARGHEYPVYVLRNDFVARPAHGLWPRDIELLTQLSNGRTYAEAAEIFGRSIEWVNTRVKEINDTLGAANTPGAVGRAFRLGLIA